MADPNMYRKYRQAFTQLQHLINFLNSKKCSKMEFVVGDKWVVLERWPHQVITLSHRPYEGTKTDDKA